MMHKMERTNLKNHQTIGGRSTMKDPIYKNNGRESWEYCTSNVNHHGGDLLSGYLWNPRSYACSFCQREFRSAQALGGHMNVHRRERARLRHYSPPSPNPNPLLNQNLNPRPNTNLSNNTSGLLSQFSSTSTDFFHISTTLPLIKAQKCVTDSSTCHREDDRNTENKYSKALLGMGNFEGFRDDEEYGILKNDQIVRLDLEIGLIVREEEANNLDLELRLGR